MFLASWCILIKQIYIMNDDFFIIVSFQKHLTTPTQFHLKLPKPSIRNNWGSQNEWLWDFFLKILRFNKEQVFIPFKTYTRTVYNPIESGQRNMLWAWSFSTHEDKNFISKYCASIKNSWYQAFMRKLRCSNFYQKNILRTPSWAYERISYLSFLIELKTHYYLCSCHQQIHFYNIELKILYDVE